MLISGGLLGYGHIPNMKPAHSIHIAGTTMPPGTGLNDNFQQPTNDMKTRRCLKTRLALFASLLMASATFADTQIWTGNGFDSLWSTGANWTNATAATTGTPPGPADAVQFYDSSYSTPFVDGAFGGTISSLRFGSTNTDYLTAISSSLNISGAGGLRVGTPGSTGTAVVRSAGFYGAGGSLNMSNSTANLVLNQGDSTANGSHAILNMENLDTFNADLNGLAIGSVNYENSVAQRNAGTLYLARSNRIVLRYSIPAASYLTTATTNALEMVHVGAGNNAAIRSYLYLGITNAIYTDSINIGKSKSSTTSGGIMMFNPNFLGSSPVAYFRGIGGDNSRVSFWSIGDMNNSASSAQHAMGTNDFTGGRVDALVDVMSLGRDCVANHSASGGGRINMGTLTFDNGTINVNTLIVGNQSLAQAGSTSVTPNHGYVNINGANATLIVNTTLKLADTSTQTHTGAKQTFGRVLVNGGTLRANAVTIGANTDTNAIIEVSNAGTFVLSNTLATASKPLSRFSMADSSLGLHLTGAPAVGYVTNLLTSGGGNTINIGSSVVFSSYPAQVTLFKYTTMSNDFSGNGTHNFVLGTLATSVAGAYLTNNTFNSSLDLFIPDDPRPVITTQPASYVDHPNVSFNLSVVATGVPTLSYQWRRSNTNLSNGGSLSGVTTDTLSFTSAQETDSGAYTVVIQNAYGSTTSGVATVTISASDIAPVITGPNNQSVLQGNDATFSTSVSGLPAPSIWWFKNGAILPGQTSASLTIFNAQYPADQATYSIVASNSAGIKTNSAFLTVVVPPGISTEPVNAVVPQGSPASFNVVATGNPSPTYQWSKNNTPIPNQTNATLSFASAQPADAASYAVQVSNAGGVTNSTVVTLTVTSTTLTYTNLSPADGATGVCYDTPLYMKFNTTPVLGTGTLRIYDSGDNLVDTLDLSQNQANNGQIRTIAGQAYYTYPVIIRSNTAAIFPHLGVLTSNTTYYVQIDNGFFRDTGGASMVGIANNTAWNFTTKIVGPDPVVDTNVVVAADGSGDFATIQGVIDWVPSGNLNPITVLVKKGTYEEINRIPTGKNFITFIGEGCQESVIAYANNNTFQLANAGTATRGMFYAGGNDTIFKNLTFTNSTPQGGSQAEAIRVQGLRIILDNCKFASFQDTILINTANTSSGYFNKCLVQGDVDFIWGSGIGFFDQCEIRAMQRSANSGGVYTQARTGAGVYGLIFRDCDITKSVPAVTNNWTLGRDGGNGNPYGNVAWLNCRMDDHISGAGWTDGGLTDKSTLRFWEYLSRNITDTAYVATNSRVAWSRQLYDTDPDPFTNPVNVGNPTNVFASILWEPVLAPYIACQPTNQSALIDQTVTVSAAVGGIPQPVYQWYKGATPVPNGTNEDLVISNAQSGDAGTYSLRVTNDLGFVISDNAVLTMTAPVSPTITNPTKLGNGNFQFSFSGASGQPYRIWASANAGLGPVISTWTQLGSGTFGGSPVVFTDTTATSFSQRYYIVTVP